MTIAEGASVMGYLTKVADTKEALDEYLTLRPNLNKKTY
tara:strand:+ start:316 stop:432 length:117 start_codon:yes stop_codon:yes gene_type:complete